MRTSVSDIPGNSVIVQRKLKSILKWYRKKVSNQYFNLHSQINILASSYKDFEECVNLNDISYPGGIPEIKKIEGNNRLLRIAVYSHVNGCFYPIYKTNYTNYMGKHADRVVNCHLVRLSIITTETFELVDHYFPGGYFNINIRCCWFII